jgi:nucleolar protein 9
MKITIRYCSGAEIFGGQAPTATTTPISSRQKFSPTFAPAVDSMDDPELKRTRKKKKSDHIRDEKRKRKRKQEQEAERAKRQRVDEAADYDEGYYEQGDEPRQGNQVPEKEFFGLLVGEEQDYFKRADDLLELNDFPTAEDRTIFVENVFAEAQGKELRIASSQSCSRLMEKLILLSNTAQKKRLFAAFAGHFVTLVTHRFASHCCEQLFLRSAAVVSREVKLGVEAPENASKDPQQDPTTASMEELFLYTLDEFEGHLSALMSDRFASHTLRVILVVLSGRPLEQAETKSLIKSKKKEDVSVVGLASADDEENKKSRAVPDSFGRAIQKIIADSTGSMDSAALRVLATHPTGNPVLQLLLELDITLNTKASSKGATDEFRHMPLLDLLLPEAPSSLGSADSQASQFVNSMLYDSIGSRLLETLIAYCPGKIFKPLYANHFGPRIHTLLRNDIASYPAIKVLNRLSKHDLAEAVDKVLPTVATLIEKNRFSSLQTLFERCNAREMQKQITALLDALANALHGHLVPGLCLPSADDPAETKQAFQGTARNTDAASTHGSHLAAALLAMPGRAAQAVRASILSMSADQLLLLATKSPATAGVLVAALRSEPAKPPFHKPLVAALLLPHAVALALSPAGSGVLCEVAAAPAAAVPVHLKEAVVGRLAEAEAVVRAGWTGRRAWRAWKADLWRRRRADWVIWARGV